MITVYIVDSYYNPTIVTCKIINRSTVITFTTYTSDYIIIMMIG